MMFMNVNKDLLMQKLIIKKFLYQLDVTDTRNVPGIMIIMIMEFINYFSKILMSTGSNYVTVKILVALSSEKLMPTLKNRMRNRNRKGREEEIFIAMFHRWCATVRSLSHVLQCFSLLFITLTLFQYLYFKFYCFNSPKFNLLSAIFKLQCLSSEWLYFNIRSY